MIIQRRSFIKKAGLGTAALFLGGFKLNAMHSPDMAKVTILHTNDVHSRIEPFPMDGGRNQGMGGVSQRAALLRQIRSEEDNVLLLDAGDIFQGTPYFNFFGGELEMKLMSELQYDAATIGNHDFDGGMDGLLKSLDSASFPLINANYDFSDTIMSGHVEQSKIFVKDGIKIGVTGVGIELKGLVPSELYGNTRYSDPVKALNMEAKRLKEEMGCNYIICLSHLGYKYGSENKISDVTMAGMTENVDLIIGGHTHTFMSKPDRVKNKVGQPIIINQVGFAGIMLGRIDVYFEKGKVGKCITCKNEYVR